MPAARRPVEPVFDNGRTRVWRADDPHHGVSIHKEALGQGAPERIAHEVSILRRLDGVPGVPRVRSSLDPRVLTYADSGARVLGEVLAERRLDAWEALALGEGLARILAGVHEAGVAHHDLHPWNVLLAEDGGVELIDFDLATTIAEIRTGFTHHREILGRLPYLSPEQTGRTGAAVDTRSDLYALGAVLYEAATGRPPFTESDAFELVREILTREPIPITQLHPMMPPALDAVVARLLEKEPDRRYQSAGGVAHDLARIAAEPGAIFSLGERDFPSRLSAPTRLIGRASEMEVLAAAVDAVARSKGLRGSGTPARRVVLVCGGPGVGKSALVNTLRPLVTRRRGWFVAGKADQVVRDSSAGLHTALRRLAGLLLAEPPTALAAQVHLLRERLGSNAAALVAMAPEFGQILGNLAGPKDMDEREREDRTRQAVIDLFRAVASPARPIVLFLDDLQWAPPSVLDILDAIVTDAAMDGLLLVGAYRGTEVEHTRLATILSRWERLGVEPTTLRLTPLDQGDLATFLGQVLRLPAERAAELAGIVRERTAGNPFDTIELLNSLRESGALELVAHGWTWDAAAIQHHVGGGDVVALLSTRIENLGQDAAHLLAAMACLGGEVSRADLATSCGLTAAQVDRSLARPLEAGLVTTVRYGHPRHAAKLRFRHDRVQQAAFERLPTEGRRLFQAQMGRRLTAAGRDLLAAQQFLAADVPSCEPDEDALVVRLYRGAAADERRRTNFTAAEQYLAAAARLLAEQPPPAQPTSQAGREQFEVESERHQVLYQLGRLDEADRVYAWLRARTQEPLELAEATASQVASMTNRHQSVAALKLGLDVLARMGVRYPEHDAQAEVTRGLVAVVAWTARLDTAVDAHRPALSDPTAAALVAVMARLSAPAFFSSPLVAGWLVTQAMRLWEEHGPSSDLMAVLGHGHVAFVAVLDEFRAGEVLLRHLIAVGEANEWERAVAYTRFLYAVSAAHWFEPLEACEVVARQARDGLLHVGDLPQACWAYFPLVVTTFESAPTLDHSLTELGAALALADRTGILPGQHCFSIVRQFCDTAQRSTEDAPTPGIEALADVIPIVGAYLRLFRSIAAALEGDHDQLATNSRTAHRQAQHLPGIVITLIATVLFGLDLSLALRNVPPGDGAHADLLTELDGVLTWLRRRAKDQPDNVTHLVHYLEAERAWALGDHDGAITSFDAALSAVQRLCRPWHHVLLARRAGELHRERGLEHSGRLHLAEARQALLDWGADAIAADLERTYPFLRPRVVPRSGISSASTSSSPTRLTSDAIDTTAILRVAQALAAQTTMAQLHSTIVDQLSAITGATAVQVVLRAEGAGWRIYPTTADTAEDPGLDGEPAAALLPVSAVRYAMRTREILAVDDATADDRFARDPYLEGKQRLALLVVPVLRSGDLRAVLVLENRLTSGTFTSDRLGFVDMLTGQLAVALDNALLYASLEQRIAERTDELRSANAQLELLSATDALTGVANRRSFDAALAAEWTNSPGAPMSVIMADVDNFKKYNDHLGHPAGDACLVEISRLLGGSMRDTDLLCRYGGEEFAAVLPRTDLAVAVVVAERMRAAVEGAALSHAPTIGTVTISVGVASSLASTARLVSELLAGADAALYAAKHAGRNCVRARTACEPRPASGGGA